jgi:hypothetical protein
VSELGPARALLSAHRLPRRRQLDVEPLDWEKMSGAIARVLKLAVR